MRTRVHACRMMRHKSSQSVVRVAPTQPWSYGFRCRWCLPGRSVHCRTKDKTWRCSEDPQRLPLGPLSKKSLPEFRGVLPYCSITRNKTTCILRRATFFQKFHGIEAAKHCLKFIPTSPDGLPSGGMIALSVLMSPEASQGIVEVMD